MDKEPTKEEVLAEHARELAQARHGNAARAPGMAEEAYESPFRASKPRKRGRNWRGVLGFINPPLGQPLAFMPLDRDAARSCVLDAKLHAVVPAEAELVQIALKVLLAAVLVDANHAALEHAEVAFHGVRGHVAAGVFLQRRG